MSRAEFAISGKVTRLGLEGQNLATFFTFPRETSVYVQSERLALAPYPVTTAIGGDQLPLAVPAEGLQPGRRLIVKGKRVDGKGDAGARSHACRRAAASSGRDAHDLAAAARGA